MGGFFGRLFCFASRTAALGPMAIVIGLSQLCLAHAFAQVKPSPVIKPDQYDVSQCKSYFKNNLKPGLRPDSSSDGWHPAETNTYELLCEANSVDLSAPEADGRPRSDDLKTLRSAFIRALVESNQFDAPGYDRISIKGAIVSGDLSLSKIDINNAIELNAIDFQGNVDLSYSSSSHTLEISGSLRDGAGICLRGFQSEKSIFIHDITQTNKLNSPKPFCYDSSSTNGIDLQGARIGGELDIRNVRVNEVEANGAQIAGQVDINNSEFARDIDFSGASAGQFTLRGVKVAGGNAIPTVSLDGSAILGYAQFVRSDFIGGISMTGAHVAKNVQLLGSTLGLFDFTGSTADGDLEIGPSSEVLPSTEAPRNCARLPVWLTPPKKQPTLVLSHSSVTLVRVALNNWPGTASRISGVLTPAADGCLPAGDYFVGLCSNSAENQPPGLPEASRFDSQSEWLFGSGAKADSPIGTDVADFRFKAFAKPTFCAFEGKARPSELQISPTSFQQSSTANKLLDYVTGIVNLNGNNKENKAIKENEMELWLSSTQYSPSEYQLIHDLLTTNGQSGDARKIGYVGKLTENSLNSGFAFFGMTASRLFIGYGYCPYLAFFWAAIFFALGAFVFVTLKPELIRVSEGSVTVENPSLFCAYFIGKFRVKKKDEDYGVINPLGYSFDMLLPVIRLRELHYELDLGGWQRFYFYFQKIAGWALGIFVLAALSGLTK